MFRYFPLVFLVISFLAFQAPLQSFASFPPPAADMSPPVHPKFRAIHFEKLTDLNSKQLSLLLPYLLTLEGSTTGSPPDSLSETYDAWVAQNDGVAAVFLAWTQALTFLQIRLQDGRWITADQLMVSIHDLEGDRIKVFLDAELVDSWRAAGASFILTRLSGEIETGHFNFDHGDLGGLLHDGSNIQGYTSYFKVPRIQINYTLATHLADIDLDGYAPWIDGFIPDPCHLTWQNSDVRYWYPEYEKSFGYAGFEVIKNTD